MNALDQKNLVEFDALPDTAYVRVGTVAALYTVTPACIWAWTKKGLILAPRKLGPQVTAWNVGELKKALHSAA